LKFTTEPETNPLPLTVIVDPMDPTITVAGEIADTTGAGLLTVNVEEVEVPPPGAGLVTVTVALPAVATSEADRAT